MKTIRIAAIFLIAAAALFLGSASFAAPCQNCGGGSSGTDGPTPIPPGGIAFQSCVSNCVADGGKAGACQLLCNFSKHTVDPILSY